MQKACARMSRWQWLLSQVSFRGMVLILNNLVASSLWHKPAVLTPPEGFLRVFQTKMVNFFWSGQHWLRAVVLYLPLQEGGQGLMDVGSKVTAFRLQAAQRLLYERDVSWRETACALLRKAGGLGLDRHLLLMELEPTYTTGLTDFYATVLRAWTDTFCVQRVTKWSLEKPLFKNPLLNLPPMILASVGGQFRRAGLTKLVHLRRVDGGGWRTAEDMAAQTGVHSLKLVEKIMAGVQAFWPCLQRSGEDDDEVEGAHTEEAPFFPSVHVQAKVGEWLEEEGKLLTFNTPELGVFKTTGKKVL